MLCSDSERATNAETTTEPATTMGAIISKVQYDRVMSYIDAGKSEGARVVYGGKRPDDPALKNGFYIEPTVFADVNMSMRIAKEEIFGPVVSVISIVLIVGGIWFWEKWWIPRRKPPTADSDSPSLAPPRAHWPAQQPRRELLSVSPMLSLSSPPSPAS